MTVQKAFRIPSPSALPCFHMLSHLAFSFDCLNTMFLKVMKAGTFRYGRDDPDAKTFSFAPVDSPAGPNLAFTFEKHLFQIGGLEAALH